MDPLKPRTPDPQWDLALEIARALEMEGSYGTAVEMSDAQRVVDLRWAAHQAGRLLGMKTRVVLTPSADGSDTVGVATVTGMHAGGVERARAQEGVRDLLHTVQREQTKTLTRPTVPTPRHRVPAMIRTRVVAH